MPIVLYLQAFTGSTPYAHMAHPQIMVAVVTHNLRPRFEESCPAWYKVGVLLNHTSMTRPGLPWTPKLCA